MSNKKTNKMQVMSNEHIYHMATRGTYFRKQTSLLCWFLKSFLPVIFHEPLLAHEPLEVQSSHGTRSEQS